MTDYARGKKCLAEIGVSEGVTTRRLAAVMNPAGTYFAIDPYFPGRFGVNFTQFIAQREASRDAAGAIVWVKALGKEACSDPRVDGHTFDFLFIDGDHSYDGLKGDWEAWRPLIASGGIVGFHDTRGERFGCERYLREHILTDEEFEAVAEIDALRVFRRR